MTIRDLGRLLRPRSIAVIGGGAWGRAVIEQGRRMGYAGDIWPVHPRHSDIAGHRAVAGLADLPAAPDAAFVGVNRHATIEIVHELETMGAGGAVCFASGFSEAEAEDSDGAALQNRLLGAAGAMPLLGPNCYGFINYLDGALLWPDQHGGRRTDRGVAIVTQSSNIAINLTMQRRALPLAYIVTAGNQAQTGFAEIGAALLGDERVTALGLHIEGVGDPLALERLARRAAELGKPIVAIKVGRSQQARAATVSHTASLAGSDAGASALLERLGIARLDSLPEFLETLKLLHFGGPLAANTLASVSCSGGEASLSADTAVGRDLVFPALNDRQKRDLRAALGPMVALANPLDYHTYIWRDREAMTRAWSALADPGVSLVMAVVDFPRPDRCDASDWDCAIGAAIGVRQRTGARVALVATLPELLDEAVAERLAAGGVVPMHGLAAAMAAAEAAYHCAAAPARLHDLPAILPPGTPPRNVALVPESAAKARLAACGLRVPASATADSPQSAAEAARRIGFPVVLKGVGVAHKTETGAVVLGLATPAEVRAAARAMPCDRFLVEEMVTGAVAELLVGVVRDAAHGFVLTLAAGGTLAELQNDGVSLIVPARRSDVLAALDRLRLAPVLAGYRGAPAADREAIADAVMALQDFVQTNAERVVEVEINPLICQPAGAVAADALLRCEEET